jgi:8-oxo-dGTP pyrophosphatase MutT (NUDIX family)
VTGGTARDPARKGGLPIRRSARILLADRAERVLLFRFADQNSDAPGGVWWGTPGGGVEEGESVPAAAARELYEETGLRVAPESLGRIVGRSEGPALFFGERRWYLNEFYFLRTDGFALDDSGWNEVERVAIAEHRWWTVGELAATTETVHPPGLAEVLPDLFAGRLPAEPLELGLV